LSLPAWRPKLSFANVVSCLALFIALGGGAYAASGGFVTAGTAKLCLGQSGSVTAVKSSKKCKHGTTTFVVNQKGVAGTNGTNGAPGAPGPAGPSTGAASGDLTGNYPAPLIGTEKVTTTKLANSAVTSAKIADGQVRAADLGNIVTVTNSAPIEKGATATVNVTCPAESVVVSGGFQPSNFGVEATSSIRITNGWEYQAKNNLGSNSTLNVFAYCLEK
jgi:hypothetical protein